jgi:hypothetical protein
MLITKEHDICPGIYIPAGDQAAPSLKAILRLHSWLHHHAHPVTEQDACS